LTLDFTVNPDFGQVEADPSALTLDGFRIFFSERRPFFIENRSLFNYNISNSFAGGNYDTDNLFYSRRIGASPHRRVSGDSGSNLFVDEPDFTTILGAAKFSGKTKNGLSIGVLESVTAREQATIDDNGTERKTDIEPLTNYIVARIQQDLNNGNTVIGGVFTGVQRKIETTELEFLHKNAFSGGIDFEHKWKERKWRLNGKFVMSRVSGTVESIVSTQQSFEHYFQRPNADHLNVDPTATSLSGNGGNISIARLGNKLRFQTGITYRSPGLELNDIGFQLNSDEINHYYWMGYQQLEPKGVFRDWRINYNHWSRWDSGGQHLYNAFNGNVQGNFKNYWGAGTGLTYETKDKSNNWLRGGPTFRKPNGFGWWAFVNTDSRKKLRFNLNLNYGHGLKVKTRFKNMNLSALLRPNDALNISLGSSISVNNREDQYVETATINGNTEYILSSIDQKTLSFTLRINYNITPDFTIQYYGQPFISRGNFSEFKKVLDPVNKERNSRFENYTAAQLTYDEEESIYSLDADLDGEIDYQFGSPDFNFLQFRSNLVVRWEYIPGSEVFLVWSQGTTNSGDPDKGIFSSLSDDLFGQKINNIFLLKLTYRFLN
jgi:hypothetical protein